MLVRYRGINNKGVLERPGTKWKVLKAISTTFFFFDATRHCMHQSEGTNAWFTTTQHITKHDF